jgi:hypothetical protein
MITRALRRVRWLAVAALVLGPIASPRAAGPRFFPDDPIEVDNDRALDAGGAAPIETGNYYDFAHNTFGSPGQRADITALNINTVGEVPDSSWFTNRIGRAPMSIEDIVRGPDRFPTLNIDGWPIVRDKGTGLQPGYRVLDPSGHLYQIEFDPASNEEMATGAEIIGTAFYHAFGYNVVDVYIVEVDPAKLVISPEATIRDLRGRRRQMTRTDVDEILNGAARQPNGRYRALASRFADGRPLGNFSYAGVRPDDPNDIFLHEHRRELRANRVFGAWLNHDDSRGVNSLDMLEGPEGRRYIKHYMFDFGSILGSGTAFAQVPRGGNEYIADMKEGFKTLATLGLYVRPWMLVDYPNVPDSVGRFESEFFDPEAWKPEYPNPAFENLQPDDAFWAARIIAQFSDGVIHAVVEKARYSDQQATDYITRTLIERRAKVLRTWLNQVNPIDAITLSPSGRLSFENVAVRAGVARPATQYTLEWSKFDNAADTHTAVGGEMTVTEAGGQAPDEVLQGSEYISVRLRGTSAEYSGWENPTQVYFRRDGSGWKVVGIERASSPAPARTSQRGPSR